MWWLFLLASIAQADFTDYMNPDAVDHLKQALLVESGETAFQNNLEHYYLLEGKTLVNEWGLQPEERALGGCWYLYKHREIPLKISDSTKFIIRQSGLGFEYHW